jgi:hypothetical protein
MSGAFSLAAWVGTRSNLPFTGRLRCPYILAATSPPPPAPGGWFQTQGRMEGAPQWCVVQLFDGLWARLRKRHYRSKEALFHNTLGLTVAALDSVAWLIGNETRQKVGHAVNAVERLGGPLNQGSTLFREDANLHPNKLTDPKAILSHAERTYWVVPSSRLPLRVPNKEPRLAEHRTRFWKLGAGGTVLPRRRMRGFLNVACFTRDRSSVAASVCKTRLLSEVVRSEAAHLFSEFHTGASAKSGSRASG